MFIRTEFELVINMGFVFIHSVLDVQLYTFVSRPKNKMLHKNTLNQLSPYWL
jgi:hypothetical protein